MATEQEELRLQVTLVDNASAGLANLQKQLNQLATGQTVAGLEKMNKVAAETASKLKGVKEEGEKAGGVTMAFARGIGLAAGAVAAFGYNLVATLDKFAQAGVKLRVLSNETGLLPGQLRNLQEQMQQFGISTDTANQNIKGFQTALADVVKNASEIRNKLMAEAGRDPQNQANMQALLRRVMGLGQAGETEEAMSEIISATREIIDNQIKAGASPALAAERGRQFLALWGMTPDVLSIVGPLKRASAEQLADAEKRLRLQEQYNTEMNKTNQQWDNFKQGLQEGILKTLSEINKEFGNTEALGKALAGAVQGIVEGVRTSAREIQAIINGVRQLIAIFTGTSGDKPEPSTMSGDTGHGGAQGAGAAGGVQGLPGSPSGPSVRGNRSIQNDELSPEAQERLRRKYRRGGGAPAGGAGSDDLANQLGLGALGGPAKGGATQAQRFAGGADENKFVRWARENNAFSTNIEDRRGETQDRTKNVSDLTFEIKRLTDFLQGKTSGTGPGGGAVGFMGGGTSGGGGGGGFGGIPGYGGPAGYSGSTPGGRSPGMGTSIPGYGPPGGGGPNAGAPMGAGAGMTPGAPGMRGGGPAGWGGGGGSSGYTGGTPGTPSAAGVPWPTSPFTGGGGDPQARSSKEGEFYQKMLKAYEGSPLIGQVPKDGHLYGITTGSKEEWARFATATAKAESSFNPNLPGPANDPGGSHGIFQYAHGQVPGGNAYDEAASIRQFVADSERSIKETGALRGDPMMRGGQKSWSGLLGARFSTIGNHPERTSRNLMPMGQGGSATQMGGNVFPTGGMNTMPTGTETPQQDLSPLTPTSPRQYGRRKGEPGEFNTGPTFGPPGQNMTQIEIKNGQKVTVRAEVAERYKGFLNEMIDRGYPVDLSGGGGFVMREKRGGGGYSMHSYGTAVDINVNQNPMAANGPTNMPEDVESTAWKHGLSWGGRFGDPMHFEAMTQSAWDSKRKQLAQRGLPDTPGAPGGARVPGRVGFLTGTEGRITSGGWQDTYLDRKEMDRTMGKEITSKVEGEGKVTVEVGAKKADDGERESPLKDIPIKRQRQMSETSEGPKSMPRTRQPKKKEVAAATAESHDPSLDS